MINRSNKLISDNISSYKQLEMIRSIDEGFGKEDMHSFEILVESFNLIVIKNELPSLQNAIKINQIVFA